MAVTTSAAVEYTATTPRATGTLGLPAAIAMIAGSIVGTGIFTLPSAIAKYGMVGLFGFFIATFGAIALGLVFARLSRAIPGAQGGPYAYARTGFGDVAGFINAFLYWCAAWPGNSGIVISWVFYVQALFGLNSGNRVQSIIIAMIGLWIPVLINLRGVGSMGAFQTITTVLKFLPLVFLATIGLYFAFTLNNWPSWNPSGDNTLLALSSALTVSTFAYVGVETAAIVAAKVKNPETNVPKATLYGTLATALVYILVTVAIFGIVPNETLQVSGAPFSDAFNQIFGGSWGGKLVAAFAVISGIGALNGWTMICGEVPQAAARNKLFPSIFAKENKNGVPAFGIISSTVLASVAVILALSTSGGVDAFAEIVKFSGVTVGVPYFFSVLVQLYWLYTEGRKLNVSNFGRDVAISGVALGFTFWMIAGSGQLANFLGMLILLLGFVMMMYLFIENGRFGAHEIEQVSGPESVRDDATDA